MTIIIHIVRDDNGVIRKDYADALKGWRLMFGVNGALAQDAQELIGYEYRPILRKRKKGVGRASASKR